MRLSERITYYQQLQEAFGDIEIAAVDSDGNLYDPEIETIDVNGEKVLLEL